MSNVPKEKMKQAYSYAGVSEDYSRAEVWETDTPRERLRLDAMVGLVPSGIRSVLDVGCGGGAFLNRLDPGIRRVGCDVSPGALERCRFPTIEAALPNIPVDDRSFELVTCMEVLEHLPDELLQSSVRELQRIAERYVLISVPHREAIQWNSAKCADCGGVYNKWGHLQSFDQSRIHSLFGSWKPEVWQTIDEMSHMRPSKIACRVNQALGNWATGGTVACPYCRSLNRVPRRNDLLARLGGFGMRKFHEMFASRTSAWIAVLFSAPGT